MEVLTVAAAKEAEADLLLEIRKFEDPPPISPIVNSPAPFYVPLTTIWDRMERRIQR